MSLEINRADVLCEVTAASNRYEEALKAGDRDELNAWFWNDDRVSRFGPDGSQYGFASIVVARGQQTIAPLEQQVIKQTVTTFGGRFAVTSVEFRRRRAAGVGRRTQCWIKIGDGWRIASAHVSFQLSGFDSPLSASEQTGSHADVPCAGALASAPRGSGLLALSALTRRFGAVTALNDVSLTFASGEVHCLLGENGAGKSTLCNLVFGLDQPDAGAMTLAGAPYRPARPAAALEAGVAMVHQHFSLVPELTVVENVILGQEQGWLRRGDRSREIEALAERFGMAVRSSAKVGTLSVGERQRIEILKCLMRSPRVLILDEPTAVLPPAEIDAFLALCRRAAEDGAAVVLVTHKLQEIHRVADRVTVLRHGRVVVASTTPSADMTQLVRAMIGHEAASDPIGAAAIGVAARKAASARIERSRSAILRLDGLTFDSPAGERLVDGVSLSVWPGEIVGVAGVEGNGQTPLARLIAGDLAPLRGHVWLEDTDIVGRDPAAISAAGLGVVPEDRHADGCIVELSLTENLCLDRVRRMTFFGLMRRRAMEARARDLIRAFDIRAAGPDMRFSSLSGGNQQKAVLAREISLGSLKVLLASQPTRGLDVGAIESVYAIVREACARGVGVLLISSELDELMAVADRILVLYRGRIVGERSADARFRGEVGALMSGQAA